MALHRGDSREAAADYCGGVMQTAKRIREAVIVGCMSNKEWRETFIKNNCIDTGKINAPPEGIIDDDLKSKYSLINKILGGKLKINRKGYVAIKINVNMHDLVVNYDLELSFVNFITEFIIHRQSMTDHINGIKHDNRKQNLRVCTHAENCRNRLKRSIKTSSNFIGVTSVRGKWQAGVSLNGKYFYKIFTSELDAAKHRDIKALELHGEYVKLNFPEELNNYRLKLSELRERVKKNNIKDFDFNVPCRKINESKSQYFERINKFSLI